jgi:deoxycytidylate deaminase
VKSGKIKWKQKKLNKYDKYLRIATEWGALSYCVKKVGAIIVKDRMIISDGYNGTLLDLKTAAKTRGLNNGMFYMLRQMLF